MRTDNKRQVLLTIKEQRLIEIIRAYGIPPEEVFQKFNLPLPQDLKQAQ